MSDTEGMSYVALHSYWVSCMASNVPTTLTDPHTIERVAALLRSRPATPVPGTKKAPERKEPGPTSPATTQSRNDQVRHSYKYPSEVTCYER